MSKIYQMTRAAELRSLVDLRSLIDLACLDYPEVDDQTRYDMKLAVDEACTNIITHGYEGMNPGSIIFQLEMDHTQARITLTDFGRPFEPSEAPPPDVEAALEDRPAGGFGLFFIYQTMDSVDYETDVCGNRLLLTRRLRTPPAPEQRKEQDGHQRQ